MSGPEFQKYTTIADPAIARMKAILDESRANGGGPNSLTDEAKIEFKTLAHRIIDAGQVYLRSDEGRATSKDDPQMIDRMLAYGDLLRAETDALPGPKVEIAT